MIARTNCQEPAQPRDYSKAAGGACLHYGSRSARARLKRHPTRDRNRHGALRDGSAVRTDGGQANRYWIHRALKAS